MTTEQQVTIDGINYNLADLSDDARAQITNVRYCEQKAIQLQQDITIVRTARATYLDALKRALESAPPVPADGDTTAVVAGSADVSTGDSTVTAEIDAGSGD
ncbi:MAG: hypothetical protein ACI87W_000786 [Halieaceae bacterium]|jgi:hypothetical protein